MHRRLKCEKCGGDRLMYPTPPSVELVRCTQCDHWFYPTGFRDFVWRLWNWKLIRRETDETRERERLF